MVLSRRDQGLLVFLVILLLGVAFYRFVYEPTSKEITSIAADNQQLELEKQRLTVIKNTTPTSTPKDQEDLFAGLDKRLPLEAELIPLLTMLDETIADCKLPFASLDYKGAETNPAGAQTLFFTVGVKGSVYQLFNLLTQLEDADRLVTVEHISFTGVKVEPKSESSEGESSPPVYYIEPPGIPEAKLQRIKVEVVQEESDSAEESQEKPVAQSFLKNNYDMKLTIKSYYAADHADTGENENNKEASGETEGEV